MRGLLQVDRQTFDSTVQQLNVLFAEAEMLCSSTYCESCCACLTAYLIYLCIDTHYEKVCHYNSGQGLFRWLVLIQ